MSNYLRQASRMIAEAKTASGLRPNVQEERARPQRASEELGYALHRKAGTPDERATEAARQIEFGPTGRLLPEMSFSGGDDE